MCVRQLMKLESISNRNYGRWKDSFFLFQAEKPTLQPEKPFFQPKKLTFQMKSYLFSDPILSISVQPYVW